MYRCLAASSLMTLGFWTSLGKYCTHSGDAKRCLGNRYNPEMRLAGWGAFEFRCMLPFFDWPSGLVVDLTNCVPCQDLLTKIEDAI